MYFTYIYRLLKPGQPGHLVPDDAYIFHNLRYWGQNKDHMSLKKINMNVVY